MNKEKAFIILTPGFPSSEDDTTCLPMQQQFVKTISFLYPNLHIIILSFQYPYSESHYQWFGTTVISFNGKNKGGLKRLLLRKKVNKTLNGIHKQKQIIGLLSFWLNECAAVGKLFAEKNNIPHYCWLLGQDARPQNKYPKRLQVQPGELVALSEFLQEEFERNHGIRPLHIVPPGMIKKDFAKAERDIDLLAVGSLIPLKQLEIFIEVVSNIQLNFSSINAWIIGDGPEREKLQQLIDEAGMQHHIQMPGMLAHEEVLCLMQRSKILIHPSSYEGFSGACVEALSSGAHVISFCRAMKDDIVNWHIVNDKAGMIQKTIVLLKSPMDHSPSLPFLMSDTVEKMMGLYFPHQKQQASFSRRLNNEVAFSKTN